MPSTSPRSIPKLYCYIFLLFSYSNPPFWTSYHILDTTVSFFNTDLIGGNAGGWNPRCSRTVVPTFVAGDTRIADRLRHGVLGGSCFLAEVTIFPIPIISWSVDFTAWRCLGFQIHVRPSGQH